MKKILKNTLLAAVVSVGASYAYLASAEDPPPPPPPPPPPSSLNECSPGFWKNHQEFWAQQFCADAACVTFIMGELTSKGPGSDARRHTTAAALNSWADSYYGAEICPNE